MNLHDAQRLRVGDFHVDLMRRTVSSRDEAPSGKLTVKAQQVLLVLVEANGSVVSREALFARVWPDTMPTDDVLTQAVAHLRRTFGDDRDAPRYIETIAKGGYRLVAEFDWLAEPGEEDVPPVAEAPAAEPSPGERPVSEPALEDAPRIRQWRDRQWMILLLVAPVVLVLVIAWAMIERAERGSVATGEVARSPDMPVMYKAVTSMPGQERWPMLSPDGKTVAFAQMDERGAQAAILLQDTEQASSRALTSPPPGSSDHVPVWSRDGRKIAFVRKSRDACRIVVVSAAGGDEREAADCYQGGFSLFDWTPDGRGLVMGAFSESGRVASPLRLLDLTTGQWRALAYDITADDIDSLPRYSPDGKWLAFRRNLSFSDLWLMPAEGGTPRRMTDIHGDIGGWDWLPDSSGVVFSWIGAQTGLFRYDLSDGAVTALPALPAGRPVFPDVAADSWAMVFEIDHLRSGIFRIPIGDSAPPQPPERVFESSGTDLLPSISPDGTTLAFISDRSIALQLWIGELAHPQTLRPVDGITPIPRHAPVWSPDGRKLLVIGRTDEGDRLFEVDVGGDQVRRLPVLAGTPFHATYHGRADRLLVGIDAGEGRLRLVLYALPDWQALASIDDVAVAHYDQASDQVYFTRPGRAGLWRANADLGEVVQVTQALPHPAHYRRWVVLGGVAFYTGPTADCRVSWQSMTGDAGSCLVAELGASSGSPSAQHLGDWLYLALPVAQNIDVGWSLLADANPGEGSDGAGTD